MNLDTKAARVRALVMKGWSDGDIARALDMTHQHVYNTSHRKTSTFDPKKYDR